MKRLLILSVVLLPSCVTPPLTFPPSIYVAQQHVPNPDGSVRAFRVDIEDKERLPPVARYTLSPIELDERGLIPKQDRLTALTNIDGVLGQSGDKSTDGSAMVRCEFFVLVRVYRPGFRPVEIRSGQEKREWKWIPANLVEQESAIDNLLGVQHKQDIPEGYGWWETSDVWPVSELGLGGSGYHPPTLGDSGLQPGSVSAKHREVLLFAAGEYARLATSFPANFPATDKIRQRLLMKSHSISRYADEFTTEEFYRSQSNQTTTP